MMMCAPRVPGRAQNREEWWCAFLLPRKVCRGGGETTCGPLYTFWAFTFKKIRDPWDQRPAPVSAAPTVLGSDEAVRVKVIERSLGGAPGQPGSGLDLSLRERLGVVGQAVEEQLGIENEPGPRWVTTSFSLACRGSILRWLLRCGR